MGSETQDKEYEYLDVPCCSTVAYKSLDLRLTKFHVRGDKTCVICLEPVN